MNEEVTIINSNTRNEKIKNFFTNNKKILISIVTASLFILLSLYSYQIYKGKHKKELSNKYNTAVIKFKNGDISKVVDLMKEIAKDKNTTYSPLALYFLIDNNLIKNRDEINNFFDILINETSLETEIKNLIIYKKALYNADFIDESKLLEILNPLINSKSVWKSHALYLAAEYFYSKNEKKKAKEFFNEIILLENSNKNLIKEAKKRINRDFSD